MATARIDLHALGARLAGRNLPGRTEADVQSDIRTLLLAGGLDLSDEDLLVPQLETPAGDQRRIDIELGFTVIETKRDLLAAGARTKAEPQLAGYLRHRQAETGQRYVGVLTDGADWFLYYLSPSDEFREVSSFRLRARDPDVGALRVWLEGVLATAQAITPSPTEIERRLGTGSPSYELDLAELEALWASCRTAPSAQLKRELWARLLTAALGTKFEDEDRLFIEHTYLVVSAELIAHAVVGFDIADPAHSPAALLAGRLFTDAQIGGVVEEDFFDWVVEAPGGDAFVRTLARRLARFDWAGVEHDVLKVLYESVIEARQRHKLGEYYTPDWLAGRIVAEAVTEPLEQRVLDPACGSGTFVFHAVRRYLAAAESQGTSPGVAVTRAAEQITGVDLHPVAVTLARVTFLLALGTARLAEPDRGPFTVPVYLGDSLLWQHDPTLFSRGGVTVSTTDGAELFARELHFPARVLADVGRFDQLVSVLAERASARSPGSGVPDLSVTFSQFAVHPDDQVELAATFRALCELHDEGRDRIWGYYARNLARPYWLTLEDNRVDVLLGNPPWLAYRFMPDELQAQFGERSRERGLWAGAQVATHQDLSGYFVARTIELFLRAGGRFAFVMPAAVLDRKQHAGFRAGDFAGATTTARVSFEQPWDLADVEPTPFPVPCAVVFGRHTPEVTTPLAGEKLTWSGRLPDKDVRWTEAAPRLSQAIQVAVTLGERSLYDERFSNGATIYPRVLTFVESAPAGPLGVGAGRRAVRSARTSLEKPPWKDVDSLTGAVEAGFVYRLHLGRTIAPFRPLAPAEAVVPYATGRLLEADDPELDRYPGLAAWWRRAAALWERHRGERVTMTLAEQLDYQRKLTKQFPVAPHRVVFAKSGMTLAAARLSDPQVLVENTLYWAAAATAQEAHYLAAVLNSDSTLRRVAALQSRGQFGRRDFNKALFALPIPLFDPGEAVHVQIAEAGQRAEEVAVAVALPANAGFQRLRGLMRDALSADGVASELDRRVERLLTV